MIRLEGSGSSRLTANDDRLTPRMGRMYGRAAEILAVTTFLRSRSHAAPVCAQVLGPAGIGKTEICKAALAQWLAKAPDATAFYVDMPNDGTVGDLLFHCGRALGVDNVASIDDLLPLLNPGLYFFPKMERVVQSPEGESLISEMCAIPGVRVLISSCVGLTETRSETIHVGALDVSAAADLFRSAWNGSESVEESSEILQFVEQCLRCHPLSILLTASLGAVRSCSSLIAAWQEASAQFAPEHRDPLSISLRLTTDLVRLQPGGLVLWTVAALFPNGIPVSVAEKLEQSIEVGERPRQLLCIHNIWELCGDRFRQLAPIARYALDEARLERQGFSWRQARFPAFGYFQGLVANAGDKLLDEFEAILRFLITEANAPDTDPGLLEQLNVALTDVYKYRAAQSSEVLQSIFEVLPDSARTRHTLGVLLSQQGRFGYARELLEEALDIYASESDDVGQGITLLSLGDMARGVDEAEDSVEAIDYYERSIKFSSRTARVLDEANATLALGEIEGGRGIENSARGRYKRALELYERASNVLGKARTLSSFGAFELSLGRTDVARIHFEEALELHVREKKLPGEAALRKLMGDLEMRVLNRGAARKHYELALELHSRDQNRLGMADSARALGDVDLMSEDLQSAKERYRVALDGYKRAYDIQGEAGAYKSLGDVAVQSKDFPEARRGYWRAYRRFAADEFVHERQYVLNALAKVYMATGDTKLAGKCVRKARELTEED